MSRVLKIGIIQQEIQSSTFGTRNRTVNMNNIENNINSLMEKCNHIDVIVLPEEFYTGSSYNFTSVPENFVKNKGILRLCEIAKKHCCYIIGGVTGSLYSDNDDKRYTNVGFVIGRDGDIIGQQERVHLFEQESKYIVGGKFSQTFELDFGRVGLVSGIDMFDSNIIHTMVSQGAELIFSSSLIPVLNDNQRYNKLLMEKWKNIAIARAMETGIFVIGVNGIGRAVYTDGFFSGSSFVAGPLGLVKEFGNSEEIDILEIELEDIELVRTYMSTVLLDVYN